MVLQCKSRERRRRPRQRYVANGIGAIVRARLRQCSPLTVAELTLGDCASDLPELTRLMAGPHARELHPNTLIPAIIARLACSMAGPEILTGNFAPLLAQGEVAVDAIEDTFSVFGVNLISLPSWARCRASLKVEYALLAGFGLGSKWLKFHWTSRANWYLGREGPPLPKWWHPLDRPGRFLRGGAAVALSHVEDLWPRELLAQTFLQLKGILPEALEFSVNRGVSDNFTLLATPLTRPPPCSWADAEFYLEEADDDLKAQGSQAARYDYVLSRCRDAGLEVGLEMAKEGMFVDVPLPSLSGHVGYPRSKGGAGPLLERWLSAYAHTTRRDTAPREEECIFETDDPPSDWLGFFNFLARRSLDTSVELVGIAEAADKVRVISRSEPRRAYALKMLASSIRKAARRCFPRNLRLTSEPVRPEIVQQVVGIPSGESVWMSSDWSNCTNELGSAPSEAVAEGILLGLGEVATPVVRRLLLDSLTRNTLCAPPMLSKRERQRVIEGGGLCVLQAWWREGRTMSKFGLSWPQSPPEVESEADDPDAAPVWCGPLSPPEWVYRCEFVHTTAPQRRGQLMGSYTSFPVLCIANLANFVACREIADARWRSANRPWQLAKVRRGKFTSHPVLVNGDDLLARVRPDFVPLFFETSELIGLKTTLGKTLVHDQVCIVNSAMFMRIRADGPSTEDGGGFPEGLELVAHMPLSCAARGSGRGGSDAVDDRRAECYLFGSQLDSAEGVSRWMRSSCPDLETYRRCLCIWMRRHTEALKLLPSGVSYWLPKAVGGLGIRPYWTDRAKDSERVSDAQFLAAYNRLGLGWSVGTRDWEDPDWESLDYVPPPMLPSSVRVLGWKAFRQTFRIHGIGLRQNPTGEGCSSLRLEDDASVVLNNPAYEHAESSKEAILQQERLFARQRDVVKLDVSDFLCQALRMLTSGFQPLGPDLRTWLLESEFEAVGHFGDGRQEIIKTSLSD